jgi:hypothetical protein
MQQSQRREKLASVLFDLAKYLLTGATAAYFLIEPQRPAITVFAYVALAGMLLLIGWFVTPPTKES